MRKVLFSAVGVIAVSLLAVLSTSSVGFAQDKKPKVLPSDRTIRVLENFTWIFVLDHYRAKPETAGLVDDLKPERFQIPKKDARRVIRRGNISAQAQMCELPDHQAANKIKLMKMERGRKKWSKEQLLFIHFLHFTAFAARMDYIKAFIESDDNDKRSVEEKLKDISKEQKKFPCTPDMKQRVIDNIEAFVKSDGKT